MNAKDEINITWKDLVKSSAVANPTAPAPTTQVTGKYVGKNNPFNMRHYFQGWLGEDVSGLNRGDMLNFSSQYYGWRAGARNARNILGKLKASGKVPSIRNFTPIISPAKGDYMKKENDVPRHMKNISDLSLIGIDDAIDPDNDTQFFKFLTGLSMAESGTEALKGMKSKDILRAIRSGRTSVKK